MGLPKPMTSPQRMRSPIAHRAAAPSQPEPWGRRRPRGHGSRRCAVAVASLQPPQATGSPRLCVSVWPDRRCAGPRQQAPTPVLPFCETAARPERAGAFAHEAASDAAADEERFGSMRAAGVWMGSERRWCVARCFAVLS